MWAHFKVFAIAKRIHFTPKQLQNLIIRESIVVQVKKLLTEMLFNRKANLA